jgi:hypothetical protein
MSRPALPAIVAITFGGVAVGGVVAALAGRRRSQALAALETRHPAEPWLWRPDWSAGRAEDTSRRTMWSAWVFTVLWNLVGAPAGYLALREATRPGGDRAALIALIFPLVGLGLLVWALRATLRYRRYGVSRFELATLPGVVGHSLRGTVRLALGLRPADGFQVSLSCVRRRTVGSGKNRSTQESILWRDERRIEGRLERDAAGMGTALPVAFPVPADASPTDGINPADAIVWRLEVTADVPGVDYQSSFEVPVFRTAESAAPRSPDEEAAVRDPLAPPVDRQPPGSRIRVGTTRRGTEIWVPAGRNPAAAAGLTGFFLFWCAAIGLQLHFGAPLVFPLISGAFGLLILLGVLDLWLGVARITVGDGRLSIASGYLSPWRRRTMPTSDVADVVARLGMQAGATAYYDIRIIGKGRQSVTAGRSIRDKHEAEWLAATMKRAIGV